MARPRLSSMCREEPSNDKDREKYDFELEQTGRGRRHTSIDRATLGEGSVGGEKATHCCYDNILYRSRGG